MARRRRNLKDKARERINRAKAEKEAKAKQDDTLYVVEGTLVNKIITQYETQPYALVADTIEALKSLVQLDEFVLELDEEDDGEAVSDVATSAGTGGL